LQRKRVLTLGVQLGRVIRCIDEEGFLVGRVEKMETHDYVNKVSERYRHIRNVSKHALIYLHGLKLLQGFLLTKPLQLVFLLLLLLQMLMMQMLIP
jgi:hypothetical protein